MIKTEISSHHPLEKGKFVELRRYINSWLNDPTIYCNNCGVPYLPSGICCDSPEIGKNLDHCWAVIIQNKARQKISANQYASNLDNTMRLGLSMPPSLLSALERFSLNKLGEKLFVNQADMRRFAKAFPMFAIMEKI